MIINLIREKLHIDTFFSNLIKDNQFSEKQVKITKFDIRHHHRKLAEGYGQLSWFQLSNRQIRSTAINPWRIYGGRQAGLEFLACMRTHSMRWGSLTVSRRPPSSSRWICAVVSRTPTARCVSCWTLALLFFCFKFLTNRWKGNEVRYFDLRFLDSNETSSQSRLQLMALLAHACSCVNYFMVHARKFIKIQNKTNQ